MLNLEFLVGLSLVGMPQAFQKCMKLIKLPNFRKKLGSLVCGVLNPPVDIMPCFVVSPYIYTVLKNYLQIDLKTHFTRYKLYNKNILECIEPSVVK